MSHHNRAWPVHQAAPSDAATSHSPDPAPPPNWLTYGLLVLAGSTLLALAGASAWLSYRAQVAYVLTHNGNLRTEAKVWSLLLDVGTAGVSLLRVYETLQRRTNVATRASLLGCITASVVMNLLHTPSRSPGGFVVAAVPPVMYAVFLEHLLTNLRNVLVPEAARCSIWHTATLWINFPAPMWNRRRGSLRFEAEGASAAPKPASCSRDAPHQDASDMAGQAEQSLGVEKTPRMKTSGQAFRRGRGPGPKRVAFEAALKDQVRSGDLRLFSEDERERNAAAYRAAASLPAPLSRGAARRYVVQALPHLEKGSIAPYKSAQSATTPK